ncbi:MBL fold metallo-hydrolase [Natrialbaceae archaeon GCM10025810]|uniref:MBL fold metallo-hydrolase n=1 Tax=Halovalidus salilacus TaxID=3075124 RepID=UPI00360F5466
MPTGDDRSSTRSAPVSRLEFDVEWPPKHVAAYLIEREEPGPILVDAGDPTEQGESVIRDGLAAAGFDPVELEAVVVTHPHSDHIGGVPVARELGADVYAPAPVLEQLEREENDLVAGVREIGRSAGYRGEAIEREVERAADSLRRNRRLLEPESAIPFEFGEPFAAAGLEFEPIHTPGHQVHHASLRTTLGRETVLFSGDSLIEPFRAGVIHVGIDYGAYEAVDAFFDAMDRLEVAAGEIDRVYPGHGPVFDEVRGTIEFTRRDLEELVAETLESVGATGPTTPLEVTRQRVGEVRYPVQVLDTLGALGTLEGRGEIEYETRDGVRYYEVA